MLGAGTALRRGWRLGPALAVALLVAVVATSAAVTFPPVEGTLRLDALFAVGLGLVWGAAGGTLGALIAPALPAAVIRRARRRRPAATPLPLPGPRA